MGKETEQLERRRIAQEREYMGGDNKRRKLEERKMVMSKSRWKPKEGRRGHCKEGTYDDS